MKIVLPILLTFTFSLLTFSYAHDEDSTNWLNDKTAFEYTKRRLLHPQSNKFRAFERFEKFDIDPEFLKLKLSEFSGAKSISIGGKQTFIKERKSESGRDLARKYLEQEFKAIGFETGVHIYSTGKNFLAQKTGRDPSQVLIISSHIDSVGNAGANDDGIGTAAALAVARALAEREFGYTLRFVGFDEEERGLVGSRAYVRDLSGAKVIGVIQMEMMATNSRNDGAFHVIDCDRKESLFLSEKIMAAIQSNFIELKRIDACTNRSDHAAFWRVNIPAIVLSENFFGGDYDKCYHATCDVFDARLNFEYSAKITSAVTSAVAKILE